MTRLTAILLLALAARAPAQVLYTFEAPNFTAGAATPLLNVAPNSGPATFRASFTSAPTANGFSVDGVTPPPFTGQYFIDLASPADALTVQFSGLVTEVNLSFLINVPLASPPGSLRAVTPAGTFSQAGGNVGHNFVQGGTLSFSVPGGISSMTLAGFDAGNVPTFFAMDDLALTPIPEPSSLALAGVALAGAACRWRRPASSSSRHWQGRNCL